MTTTEHHPLPDQLAHEPLVAVAPRPERFAGLTQRRGPVVERAVAIADELVRLPLRGAGIVDALQPLSRALFVVREARLFGRLAQIFS